MVARFLSELSPSISIARPQRYSSTAGDPMETAVNYMWNISLAESLYYSLNLVEISPRNGLNTTLAHHFGPA